MISLVIILANFPDFIRGDDENLARSVWNTAKKDYQQFYSRNRLLRMGIVFGAGAVMANTAIDEKYQNWYQNNVRNSTTDNIAKVTKKFGEGKILIPISLVLASVGHCLNSDGKASGIGEWGKRSSRAYLVGGPALLLMQHVTGASRPNESENGSRWNFFNDSNGVSGHAFIGAVPFLTIAHMNEKNRPIKYIFYGLSMLTALSRINDNAHYLSQASLGWYMAFEATGAINERTKKESRLTFLPYIGHDSVGVTVNVQW